MASHINTDLGPDVRGVLDSIRRIVQALRTYDRRAMKRVGLSGAQLFVLQKLNSARGISVNELAERTHTHQSSVSVVAKELVDRKLVRRSRSKADGRRVMLELTARGRKRVRGAPAAAQDRLVAALQKLPAQKRRQLRVLLDALARKTGAGEGAPPLFFEEVPPRRGKERL